MIDKDPQSTALSVWKTWQTLPNQFLISANLYAYYLILYPFIQVLFQFKLKTVRTLNLVDYFRRN